MSVETAQTVKQMKKEVCGSTIRKRKAQKEEKWIE